MATIKSHTDLEQSKKLAEILPLETADMCYVWDFECERYIPQLFSFITNQDNKGVEHIDYPCWSLAALLEQLPYEICDDDGNSSYLQIDKEDDVYQLVYTDPYGDFESTETDRHEHFVDACYEMIVKLKEEGLL